MASAQAGNEADYRQLLTELAVVIHGFLSRRFGDHPFMEDCVQEALIAVHQARHTYDARRPFRPWLFAIVRHKAIDALRRRRTREATIDRYTREQQVLSQPGMQTHSEGELLEGRWFRSLSRPHREVLILTKVIGFSIAETAARLGISEGAVKVRVHRAVRELRKTLELEEP